MAHAVETAGPSDSVLVVDYGRLMSDDMEFKALELFVGRSLSDRRAPRLRRSASRYRLRYLVEKTLYQRKRQVNLDSLGRRIRALREHLAVQHAG